MRATFVLALALACAALAAVVPSTANAAGPPLRVVLLGDSYSAGNGADNYWGPSGCYRSSRNWAEKYLDTVRATRSVTFVNRACSGGVLDDLSNRKGTDDDKLGHCLRAGAEVTKDDPRARQLLDAQGDCSTSYRDDETWDVEALNAFPGSLRRHDRHVRVHALARAAIERGRHRHRPRVLLDRRQRRRVLLDHRELLRLSAFRDVDTCRDKLGNGAGDIGGVGLRIADVPPRAQGQDAAGREDRPEVVPLPREGRGVRAAQFASRGRFTIPTPSAARSASSVTSATRRNGPPSMPSTPRVAPRWSSSTASSPISPVTSRTGASAARTRTAGWPSSTASPRWSGTTTTRPATPRSPTSSRGYGDFGVGGTPTSNAGVDIAFVIDTTGSMGSAIGSVKIAATQLVNTVCGADLRGAIRARGLSRLRRRGPARPGTTRPSSTRTSPRTRRRSTVPSSRSRWATAAICPKRCTRASRRRSTSPGGRA